MSETDDRSNANLVELGRRLRRLRETSGEAAYELAEFLCRSVEWVRKVEAGRLLPDEVTLALLARHWVVSFEYLLGKPDAERDPEEVREAKARLREYVLAHQHQLGPGYDGNRIRAVVHFLMEELPAVFTLDYFCRRFLQGPEDLERILQPGTIMPKFMIHETYRLTGIPETWLWGKYSDLLAADQDPEFPPQPPNPFGPILS